MFLKTSIYLLLLYIHISTCTIIFNNNKKSQINNNNSTIPIKESTDSVGARIICEGDSDCPSYSVCYQNTCICKFGYIFTDKTRCIPVKCTLDNDCSGIFLRSKCGVAHQCECINDAYLDPFNQECYARLNPIALWAGFIIILSIIILLPAGKMITEHRRLKRLDQALALEAQMSHAIHFDGDGDNYEDYEMEHHQVSGSKRNAGHVISFGNANYDPTFCYSSPTD